MAKGFALVYPSPRWGQDKLVVWSAHQVQHLGKGLGGLVDLRCLLRALWRGLQSSPGQSQRTAITPPKAPLLCLLPPTPIPGSTLALPVPAGPHRTPKSCRCLCGFAAMHEKPRFVLNGLWLWRESLGMQNRHEWDADGKQMWDVESPCSGVEGPLWRTHPFPCAGTNHDSPAPSRVYSGLGPVSLCLHFCLAFL